MSTTELDPLDALAAYLAVLAGQEPAGRFLDVRWRTVPAGMRRRFLPATMSPAALARVIARMGARSDVYLGVALRDGNTHGGRAAISGMHLAYIESDSPATMARLATFPLAPSMLVTSGTPGHLHIYFRLDDRYPTGEVEAVNRRLAVALGGDPTCADGARILRPPSSLNHKHSPPRPVALTQLREHARYTLAELSEGLPEDPDPRRAERCAVRPRRGRMGLDRELLGIPAAEYVRVLAGRSPNREGKVCCPFHHPDRHPSLQLYPDGSFYCFGSGCKAGGTIFDFAAGLWSVTPRGAGFIDLRQRLTDLFAADRTRNESAAEGRVSPAGLSRTP